MARLDQHIRYLQRTSLLVHHSLYRCQDKVPVLFLRWEDDYQQRVKIY